MKKYFLTIITAFFIFSYSNAADPQESGEAPVPAPAEEAVTAAEVPAVETTAPAPEAVPEVPAEGEEVVLIDDALPDGATTEGVWEWDTLLKYSGERSHTESAAKGITEHSYRTNPIVIPRNSVIEQYIYLDPDNMPKGIMLKFRFENDGREDEIGIYREGEEEVFVFSNDEPMLYDGTLPNAGKWEKLQIYCDDLGLVGAKLTGISFVTYGGRAYWDLTRIRAAKEGEQYPPEE
jgi:hypothetical protein